MAEKWGPEDPVRLRKLPGYIPGSYNPQDGSYIRAVGPNQRYQKFTDIGGQTVALSALGNKESGSFVGRSIDPFAPDAQIFQQLTVDNAPSGRGSELTPRERQLADYIDQHNLSNVSNMDRFISDVAAGKDITPWLTVNKIQDGQWTRELDVGKALTGDFTSRTFGSALPALQQKHSTEEILNALRAIGRSDVLYGFTPDAGAPTRAEAYKYFNQIKQQFPNANVPDPDTLALQRLGQHVSGTDTGGYRENVSHEKILIEVLNQMINAPEIVQQRGGEYNLMSDPKVAKFVADGEAAGVQRRKARKDAEGNGWGEFFNAAAMIGGMAVGLGPTLAGLQGLTAAQAGITGLSGLGGFGSTIGKTLGLSGDLASAVGGSILHTGIGALSGKDFGDALLGGIASGVLPVAGAKLIPGTWGGTLGFAGDGLAKMTIGGTLGQAGGLAFNSFLDDRAMNDDMRDLQKQIDSIYAKYKNISNTQAAAGIDTGDGKWGTSFVPQTAQQQGPQPGVPTGVDTGPGTQTGTTHEGGSGAMAAAAGGEGGMGTEEAALFEASEGSHFADPYLTLELLPGQASRAQRGGFVGGQGGGWGRGIAFV